MSRSPSFNWIVRNYDGEAKKSLRNMQHLYRRTQNQTALSLVIRSYIRLKKPLLGIKYLTKALGNDIIFYNHKSNTLFIDYISFPTRHSFEVAKLLEQGNFISHAVALLRWHIIKHKYDVMDFELKYYLDLLNKDNTTKTKWKKEIKYVTFLLKNWHKKLVLRASQ